VLFPEFTAIVDWYNVDDGYRTSLWNEQTEVSLFDLEHMDNLYDPLFRIDWRPKKLTYGSEIVCSRFGRSELGFLAGYMREVNQYGQV